MLNLGSVVEEMFEQHNIVSLRYDGQCAFFFLSYNRLFELSLRMSRDERDE